MTKEFTIGLLHFMLDQFRTSTHLDIRCRLVLLDRLSELEEW